MLIKGLQKLTLLDYPGKIACTTAFPKIGEGGPPRRWMRMILQAKSPIKCDRAFTVVYFKIKEFPLSQER